MGDKQLAEKIKLYIRDNKTDDLWGQMEIHRDNIDIMWCRAACDVIWGTCTIEGKTHHINADLESGEYMNLDKAWQVLTND